MRKRKSSAVSKRSIFAGAVCLCLLIGAAVIQQNWGKQGHEAGQEQSAETAVLEDIVNDVNSFCLTLGKRA